MLYVCFMPQSRNTTVTTPEKKFLNAHKNDKMPGKLCMLECVLRARVRAGLQSGRVSSDVPLIFVQDRSGEEET